MSTVRLSRTTSATISRRVARILETRNLLVRLETAYHPHRGVTLGQLVQAACEFSRADARKLLASGNKS